MARFHILAVVVTLLALVLQSFAAPTSPAPMDGPRPGDFAYPPNGYENEAPGTVLRSRKIDAAAFGSADIPGTAYQLLYRTTGVDDSQPLATVTTILVPNNATDDKLVVTSTPEDAAAYKCSPSQVLVKADTPNFNDIVGSIELLLVNVYLRKGYVVSVPDYEGPASAFAVGPLAGHAVLDAARATINFKSSGLKSSAKVVGVGYSGGAIATGWAAQLQPAYAPDLNAGGFVFGGTPANLTTLINSADGSLTTGLVVLGTAGIVNGYPELTSTINQYFTKAGRDALNYARSLCAVLVVLPFAGQRFQSSTYIKNGLRLDQIPALNKVLNTLVLGKDASSKPTAPVLMFHATTDEIVPYAPAKIAAQNWCQNGANVEFLTETFPSEHTLAYIGTFAKVVDFIDDRFNGKTFNNGACKFTSIASPVFDLANDGALLGDLATAASGLFGQAKAEGA